MVRSPTLPSGAGRREQVGLTEHSGAVRTLMSQLGALDPALSIDVEGLVRADTGIYEPVPLAARSSGPSDAVGDAHGAGGRLVVRSASTARRSVMTGASTTIRRASWDSDR